MQSLTRRLSKIRPTLVRKCSFIVDSKMRPISTRNSFLADDSSETIFFLVVGGCTGAGFCAGSIFAGQCFYEGEYTMGIASIPLSMIVGGSIGPLLILGSPIIGASMLYKHYKKKIEK